VASASQDLRRENRTLREERAILAKAAAWFARETGKIPPGSGPGAADPRLDAQHNHDLKDLFKGAATTIITQAPDDPLYHNYERVVEAGTKPNLAKLTLARKIAATALALWKKEEPYRPKYRTAPEADRRA